ncbi:AAA family ATPase [Cohnella sp. GCM10027633]|uniref:AAA family ATPase n=1 Tax=unclassified Cohnella TaxID=2636738 RepID=UPI00364287A6
MIIWINGAFGAGKTTTAHELHRRLPGSHIYDPENVGYFVRKNAPKGIDDGDFQNLPIWRSFNRDMLRMMANQYAGTIIVPMTLVNPQYFDEIVGGLRAGGVEIKHFALAASPETLLRRLRTRGDGSNSWPARQIDRCVESLSHERFERHIRTDGLTVESIVELIAEEAGVKLLPDRRSTLRKRWDRLIVKLKHIRF